MEMIFDERVGKNIQKRLAEVNMTQVQLAAMLYVSPNTVSTWFVGKRRLTAENLYKIANILDVSLDYLCR